MTKNSSKI